MQLARHLEGDLRMILLELTALLPGSTAIVAGGCLRDALYGLPAKDIDVFLWTPADPVTVSRVLDKAGLEPRIEFNLGYSSNPDVNAVYQLDTLTQEIGLPVQLIALNRALSEDEMLDRIDIGLCQVGYSLSRGLFYTDQFLADRSSKRMTVTRCGSTNEAQRTVRRHARLSQKYPSYPLVVPLRFFDHFLDKEHSSHGL